jgi:hypothetical protein
LTPSSSESLLRQLGATPGRIATLTKGLDDVRLDCKPSEDSWSVNEVLAHLRACADIWGRSILAMLAKDHPSFRYVSPLGWMKKSNYCSVKFAESFAVYAKQRETLLKSLQYMPQAHWSRGASVRAGSKIREETVLSYAQRIADHEAGHCDQIERILRMR